MPESFDLAKLDLDPASEVARLAAAYPGIAPRGFRDGELLTVEGEETQDVYIVLCGAFVVEKAPTQPGGRPTILATVQVDPDQPAIVGEMSLLGTHRRSANVRSVGMTRTLCLDPNHLEAVLEGFPGLTRILCRQFSTRLRDTNNRLKELQGQFALDPAQRAAEPGEVLFKAGEPADTLHQVLMGRITLVRDGVETSVTPDQLDQGFLEPRPFLAGTLHTATATVAETCFLVTVPAARREAVVRVYPSLVLGLLFNGN